METNMSKAVEVTRYGQDGITYICAGDRSTDDETARAFAEVALCDGETLSDDMDRVDGCCTWTVCQWCVSGTGEDRDYGRAVGCGEVAWVRGACRTAVPDGAEWFATREAAAAACGEVRS